jgi:(p)ppGpp synthase/HD superfamily hydrolase
MLVEDLLRSFELTGLNYQGIRVREAVRFAAAMHGEQTRKYTHEPYVFHPVEVMKIVDLFVPWYAVEREDLLVAALLHDTVEDTNVTIDEVAHRFGPNVARIVAGLTDVSTKSDGNRAARKKIDREHTWSQAWDVQTVKCADIVSNARSVGQFDPDFAEVYLQEKALLLNGMTQADQGIFDFAWRTVSDQMEKA